MTVKLTAQQIAEKQANRLKGSLDMVRLGVENVTEAPGAKAAAQSAKWQAAMSSAETLAKWKKNVAAVTVDEWKESMLNKGVNRIPAGIDAALGKMVAYYEKAIPHINRGQEKLSTMPNLTLEDSVNRAAYWIRHMAEMQT